jgi:hypothetical protein
MDVPPSSSEGNALLIKERLNHKKRSIILRDAGNDKV